MCSNILHNKFHIINDINKKRRRKDNNKYNIDLAMYRYIKNNNGFDQYNYSTDRCFNIIICDDFS